MTPAMPMARRAKYQLLINITARHIQTPNKDKDLKVKIKIYFGNTYNK